MAQEKYSDMGMNIISIHTPSPLSFPHLYCSMISIPMHAV